MIPRKYLTAGVIALTALGLDQITKTVIRAVLLPIRNVVLIPNFFSFHYAENPGIAFSMLNDLPPVWRIPVFSLTTLIAAAIVVQLLRQAPPRALRLPLALGLILAGAFGNLVDRYRWGAVVDFIWFQFSATYVWPTFNLADAFIFGGVCLLVLDTLLDREPAPKPSPEASEATPPISSAP